MLEHRELVGLVEPVYQNSVNYSRYIYIYVAIFNLPPHRIKHLIDPLLLSLLLPLLGFLLGFGLSLATGYDSKTNRIMRSWYVKEGSIGAMLVSRPPLVSPITVYLQADPSPDLVSASRPLFVP